MKQTAKVKEKEMKDEIFKIGFPTEITQEGQVRVLVPKLKAFVTSPSEYAPSKAPVFYNPIMELNRDFAILAIKAYQKIMKREITFCEPLASTGIRGVRIAREVTNIRKIFLGDIKPKAIRLARLNIKNNGFEELIEVVNQDANFLLNQFSAPKKRFNVIDIDPFGSPMPYLDSAIRALQNKGMLALTATDLAPLCGVHPKACKRKYGGKPLRTEYCHEIALRIMTGGVAATAAKYDIGIKVLFSYSSDHYIRSYIQIEYGAKKADISMEKIGYIIHCFNCFYRESIKNPFLKTIEKCPKCNSKMNWAGPLWIDSIFQQEFCKLLEQESAYVAYKNKNKIKKILFLINNELEGPISYFVIDKICDKLSLPVPSTKIVIQKLHKNGFLAFPTHFNPRGIRTTASALKIQNLIREAIE